MNSCYLTLVKKLNFKTKKFNLPFRCSRKTLSIHLNLEVLML